MAAAVLDLPDDVISEIVLRLPPKYLLRCRAVCKALRGLASDRNLLDTHHRRQPAQPLFYCPRDAGGGAIDFRLEAVDLLRAGNSRSVVRFTEDEDLRYLGYGEGQFTVHGSCGGLLLISFAGSLYLCNPATRQSAPVPPLRASEIAGLYEHHPTGEYRVLYHRGEGLHKVYYVLAVGSDDEEGRSIGRPASSASVDAELRIGPAPACWEPPVLLCGNLHWPPQGQTSEADNGMLMLVFDTVVEVFRWLRPPPIRQLHSVPTLFEMDGILALSSREHRAHPVSVKLWLLQDYGSQAQTWVPTHSFHFEVVEVTISGFGDAPALAASFVVSRQGDVLVECSERLLHYDMDANLLARFTYHGRYVMFTRLMLRESLVPQPFFQIDYGSAGVAAPPFFQGL